MGTVLPVASRALLTAAARLGVDTDAALRAAGLRREALDDPDTRIPAASADALWDAVFRASGDPGLPWRAVLALRGDEFRVLHHLCVASATLGEALSGVARWLHLVDPRLELVLEPSHGGATLTLTMRGSPTPLPRAPAEFTVGAIVACTRHSTGVRWSPQWATFTFEEPPEGTSHAPLLGCPVSYGREHTRLSVAAPTWRAALPKADTSLRQLLEDYAARLDATLDKDDGDPLSRVRSAIAARLASGAELGEVARALAMSERSLQRSLEERDTTFRRLVDDVRFERARAWLADPAVGIGEVAWMLGFSDQRAFTRAFGRWAGQPPGAWRAARDAS